ncbi:SPOR domain-containing protein [Salipiger sp. P9]|nr:SPOR domain-containing protein [Salipiger pentaromativorans]MCR8547109.1 SPOR domain-containing protein [Salipiger pentaromativorans]
MANWAGAAVSLALVVGVGVWGYKLLVRDVTGIPVVQAMEGPMRVAPEDPGGTLADHQGLAVNDVAGTGTAAPVPDTLLLAPQAAGLSDEDVPQGDLAAVARPAGRRAPAAAPGGATLAEPQPEVAPAPGPEIDSIQALADQIAAGAAPLSELAPGEDSEVMTALGAADAADEGAQETEEVAAAPAPAGALVRSLRPQLRPAALPTRPAPEATLAAALEAHAGPREIDPASLPAGTRLAQLGAYDSPETARKEWDRFAARFGEFMDGKARVIERATSGGRVFYRLRAEGFEDISDARRFCAAFVAENADCIPVTTR